MTSRLLFRIDAVFEFVLAVVLFVAAAGVADDWQKPSWLGTPLLFVAGIALVVAGFALYWLSTRANVAVLVAVATANAVTAVASALWALLDSGLGSELRVLLYITAAGLIVLAGAQLRLAQGIRPTAPVN